MVRSRADAPHLKKAALAIEQAAWSNLGYLSYTRSHYEYYAELLDAYPEFQLCLVDEETDYPVAVASGVPSPAPGRTYYRRKDRDWVVETAGRNKDVKPNMLGGLAVSVPAVHRSMGYGCHDLLPSSTCREPRDWMASWCPCAHRRRPCILGSRSPTTWRGPTKAVGLMILGSVAIVPSVAS